MRIIEPSHYIETPIDGDAILNHIERAGRTCYKSEYLIEPDSARKFVRSIIKKGHESVLEHFNITVRFVCDRGVSHELVRHRLTAVSQESTRYANYANDRFGGQITVIKPSFLTEGSAGYKQWEASCSVAEDAYFELLAWGCTPQEARAVLPNSLKTEVVMTANLREWRHILKLRTSPAAHPQMVELMQPLLFDFMAMIPVVFDDIG